MKIIKKMTLRSRIIKIVTAATTVAGSAVVVGGAGGVEHYLVPVFTGRDSEKSQETHKEVVETNVGLNA
jgi:hypothetical protein